ncbi:DEAD-box ATP-dependent RNA helicase 13 isoform X1 [Syzygium oleosum]|uniref:DEAD-box ATP-dependent RNA helicase 13 isoform X1 n=1 Tax=Syzygium oleosum TaxID=219896 RepID=UPI0011D28AFD|nr:DEAD-box ATP-dependent RNA helicase 13 isoform X1 [Syzygium oleosum]
MADGAPSRTQRSKPKRKRSRDGPESQRLDSLPWTRSLPGEGDGGGDDSAFSLFIGSNELEGGFLSLEEIDESEYGLDILKAVKQESGKAKKSKRKKDGNERGSADHGVEAEIASNLEEEEEEEEEEVEQQEEENVTSERKKKKKKKKQKKETKKVDELPAVDDAEVDLVDDAEFYVWNDLRLHPLIMKAIRRLGFKEPTPIQKACIPAAAHRGKDVVGAAETGSGKTLAFGLPILQRLLEEREKSTKMREEKGEEAEKYAPKGVLRALIITPTRELALQVTDHLKEFAKDARIRVVPIVGGMSTEKQERLLEARPEIVVGTPGRLWELMSGGEIHLVELHSLSFFVLDEADRMIEDGHFRELQSIIDMLPTTNSSVEEGSQSMQSCVTISNIQRKKRQTFVFSATIALSADFRKKLKRGIVRSKQSTSGGLNSIETLSERAGMRENAAIIDLTNSSILANKLEESFIECIEKDKDAHLYYILSLHGQGRTIVFCTSIAALRHISSILRILGIHVWTLHSQMQQRARLKAIDHFRGSEHGVLVATDVAARGIDIPGIRTVVHYQLPHSAEVYVHRSGRTARASSDGCSIALISPDETSKFASLCRSFSKDSFQRFPLENSYMPEIMKRLSLARQIGEISRKDSQEKAQKSWLERNAEALQLDVEKYDSEEERVNAHKKRKASSNKLKQLQQDLKNLLSCPLQPKTFSHRFLAGAGVSPLLQHQFEQLAKQKSEESTQSSGNGKGKLVVIGQDCVEPLQALRNAGDEIRVDVKGTADKRKGIETRKRERKAEKKRLHDQRRKQRRKLRGNSD